MLRHIDYLGQRYGDVNNIPLYEIGYLVDCMLDLIRFIEKAKRSQ